MKLILNQDQKEFFQRKARLAHKLKLENKMPVCRPPFGYTIDKETKKWIIDDKKAEVIKKAFEMRSKGRSYKEIASETGLLYATVKYLLKNISYCGFIKYKDQLVKSHTPIISKKLYDKVNDLKGGEI